MSVINAETAKTVDRSNVDMKDTLKTDNALDRKKKDLRHVNPVHYTQPCFYVP